MVSSVKVLLVIFLSACGSATVTPRLYYNKIKPQEVVLEKAESIILPGNNALKSEVKGTIEIIQAFPRFQRKVTYMKIHITGLPPNSVHGFHIHQYGDIITAGCSSTGGHYNPFKITHGAPSDARRHVGDLGNVYADQNGTVSVIKRDFLVSLVGEYSVLGRAFVKYEEIPLAEAKYPGCKNSLSLKLHARRDDLGRGGNQGSRATGNAGARIACGVIVRATS